MLDEAQSKYRDINWVCSDATGDLTQLGKFDVVFSNAAIQWMPEQELIVTKLFNMLNDEGVLAVQVPNTHYLPIQTELIRLISSERWKIHYSSFVESYSKLQVDFYYNILCKLTKAVDLWETTYFHIMNTHADIVKWYSGSGLRMYLDCLKDDALHADFIRDYETSLKDAYPRQSDGKILFPFTRIFFVAQRVHETEYKARYAKLHTKT